MRSAAGERNGISGANAREWFDKLFEEQKAT